MKLIEINKEEFLKFAEDKETNNIFQTREWAEVKRHEGWHTYFLGLDHNGKLEAVTLVLSKELPITKKRVFYCPRGYIINLRDLELLRVLTKHLKDFITEKNGIFLRLDPYLSTKELDKDGKYVQGGYNNEKCVDVLRSLGYIELDSNFEGPRYLYKINLENDNIFKDFNRLAKDTILSNDKKGIYVENTEDIDKVSIIVDNSIYKQDYTDSDTKDFCQVFKNSKMLDMKLIKLNIKRYLQSINTIEEKVKANELVKDYKDDVDIGCSISICYGDTYTTIVTAIKDEFKDLLPQYTLHYRTIKWAKTNNYKNYIFYGIEDLKTNEYEYYRNYPGVPIKLIGQFDLVINPFHYKRYYKKSKRHDTTLSDMDK